jgi:hypothetical protein
MDSIEKVKSQRRKAKDQATNYKKQKLTGFDLMGIFLTGFTGS